MRRQDKKRRAKFRAARLADEKTLVALGMAPKCPPAKEGYRWEPLLCGEWVLKALDDQKN